MAYRTSRGSRGGYKRSGSRSYARSTGYRKAVRTGKRPRARGGAQTLRIELVGMPANPVSRAIPAALKPVAPRKAKH